MKNSVIVCEYGWIIVGKIYEEGKDTIHVAESSIVRNWNNGRGIGALAKEQYKDEYKLDYIGNVEIKHNKVLFVIPCEW